MDIAASYEILTLKNVQTTQAQASRRTGNRSSSATLCKRSCISEVHRAELMEHGYCCKPKACLSTHTSMHSVTSNGLAPSAGICTSSIMDPSILERRSILGRTSHILQHQLRRCTSIVSGASGTAVRFAVWSWSLTRSLCELGGSRLTGQILLPGRLLTLRHCRVRLTSKIIRTSTVHLHPAVLLERRHHPRSGPEWLSPQL